jgi:hypothetical protein
MAKKQLIMEKSLELFAKHGFEATSVQQITEYCGISKGAFYLSFKSKDELILALIDEFMTQFISDIDYAVKSTPNEEVLYRFYFATFEAFYKHSDFAKIFIKEQTQSFNDDLFLKLRYYDLLFQDIILSMIERLYGEVIQDTKYDLLYCIRGFMSIYSELVILNSIPIDINLLSISLVEKTNILVSNAFIPFISKEQFQLMKQPINKNVTKEQILKLMEQKIVEIDAPIVSESLILLKQHLIEPTLSPAIVRGLLENLRSNPQCKWISYLLRQYFEE